MPARYPFGHGLSYPRFAYSDFSARTVGADEATVQVTVTNTGERAGADVVQIYVAAPNGRSGPPCVNSGPSRKSPLNPANPVPSPLTWTAALSRTTTSPTTDGPSHPARDRSQQGALDLMDGQTVDFTKTGKWPFFRARVGTGVGPGNRSGRRTRRRPRE